MLHSWKPAQAISQNNSGPQFDFFFFLATWLVGILVSQPGIEPMPSALEVLSPNHWATRDFPGDQVLTQLPVKCSLCGH